MPKYLKIIAALLTVVGAGFVAKLVVTHLVEN